MNDNGTLWLPDGASTMAGEVDALFYFIYWVSVVLFIGVIGAMAYFMFRYRRRSEADRPAPIRENKLVEASWIVIPTILVLIVFTWGFKTFIKLGVAPPNAYQIVVRAQKWAWQFEYPNGATSNELHVPVSRPVKLRMSSVDVLHSFFIPEFRIKHDVVPNRYTSVWFEATRQDTFQVFCTEYCGTRHSYMLAPVIVQSQDAFNQWLQESGIPVDASPAERGALLYQQQACNGCHSLDGAAGVGPTFQGLFGSQRTFTDGTTATADENYIRESILQPTARVVQGFAPVMPAAFTGLSEEELSALIAFIQEQQ
jgi:cytochrome c oxidase subunit 2